MERQSAMLGSGAGVARRRPKATWSTLQFVSPRWHGVVDYAAAAALLLAPFPLGFASAAPAALALSVAAGSLLIVYSLLTDYPLAAARLLSFRTHLALDLAAGVTLLVVPFLLGFDGIARAYFVAMGLGVFGAVAVTDPDHEADGRTEATMRTRVGTHRAAGTMVVSGTTIEAAGRLASRYGLALVLVWIGGMKFTAYEAAGIEPFVANSPLMSWLYGLLGLQAVSNLLGVVEIGTALLIVLRPVSAKLAAAGALLAVGTFVTTLSFLVSTPGWEPSLGGFPALSAFPGQFLVKDVALLGAALQVLGNALSTLERGHAH